jgi:uncharacterized protein (TIGR02996 family)
MTTHSEFFPELLLNPSNGTFLVFADLLEEAGRTTQAALVRTSLRLRDDLTPTEQKLLGVSHPLDDAARKKLRAEERGLERQFITELGPEIAAACQIFPDCISFDRGIILNANLFFMQITSLPKGLQVMDNLDLARTQIAALPEDLQVGGIIDLTGTGLSPEAAARIPDMLGLSYDAKISALRTARLHVLADQVELRAGLTAGRGPSR